MLLLLLLPLVFARDPCNPLKVPGCTAVNPAISSFVEESLSSYPSSLSVPPWSSAVTFPSKGGKFSLTRRFENPRLESDYLLYGSVEADIIAAGGIGVISSFYLMSDDLDEIDIAELFGGSDFNYQTNYFLKGNISTYGVSQYHPMPISPLSEFHRYGVVWTPDSIVWTVNGKTVRRVEGVEVPSSPMRVIFSLWAGGDPGNSPGTIDWSGGPTDYEEGPFTMWVRNVRIENHSEGNYYVYGKHSPLEILEKLPKSLQAISDSQSQSTSSTHDSHHELHKISSAQPHHNAQNSKNAQSHRNAQHHNAQSHNSSNSNHDGLLGRTASGSRRNFKIVPGQFRFALGLLTLW